MVRHTFLKNCEYKCDMCPRIFKSRSLTTIENLLKIHMKYYHNINNYIFYKPEPTSEIYLGRGGK